MITKQQNLSVIYIAPKLKLMRPIPFEIIGSKSRSASIVFISLYTTTKRLCTKMKLFPLTFFSFLGHYEQCLDRINQLVQFVSEYEKDVN